MDLAGMKKGRITYIYVDDITGDRIDILTIIHYLACSNLTFKNCLPRMGKAIAKH